MASKNPDETDAQPSLDEIWEGDLFDRKTEAAQLIAYIESVVDRPVVREDKSAYSIAIEARYGEGKSFFLNRLAKQLEINHPVAFVDAWADDLADEPLTALAATLKEALAPFVTDVAVQSKLQDFLAKTGRVAKIAGGGALRRALSLAITTQAVIAAEEVLGGVSDDVRDAVQDGITDTAKGLVDDTADTITQVTSHSLMEKRVAEFEEGKAAVQAMKASLEAIVKALDGAGKYPPIVIVIDELDRCRPTYAIKLLEEIKHLFDVNGLVFVLALHGEQLGHSVSGAYGSKFDGRAYLRRFIDREYRLRKPKLSALVAELCDRHGISDQKFNAPQAQLRDSLRYFEFSELIAAYMKMYGLTARDSFQLIDIMQTAASLTRDIQRIYLPYFLPLAIGQMQGQKPGELPQRVAEPNWIFSLVDPSRFNSEECEPQRLAEEIEAATRLSRREIQSQLAQETYTIPVRIVAEDLPSTGHNSRLGTTFSMPDLLQTVGRFQNPKIEGG